MKRVTKIVAMVLTILLVLAMAGCGQTATTPSAASPTPNKTADTSAWPPVPALNPTAKIKIGTTSATIGGAGYYIAQAKGYFKDLGLEVEFVPFDSAAKTVPMLATNQLDLASGAISAALFNAIASGLDLKVISGIDSLNKDHGWLMMLVRKDLIDSGAVKTPADLKGKKIATTAQGSLTNVLLAKALEQGGLTVKDVQTTYMGFPDMLTALGTKGIDACIINEPTATSAVDKGLATRFLTGDKMYLNEQMGVLQASPNFVANKEVSQRFMLAYLKGVRDFQDAFFKNKNKDEILKILIAALPIKDPAVYDKMILPYLEPNGKVNMGSVGPDLDWLVKNGDVKVKPDISKVFVTDLSDYAISKIGEYK